MDDSSLFIVRCCQRYKGHVLLAQTVLPNDVRVQNSLWARTPHSYTTICLYNPPLEVLVHYFSTNKAISNNQGSSFGPLIKCCLLFALFGIVFIISGRRAIINGTIVCKLLPFVIIAFFNFYLLTAVESVDGKA